MSTLSTGTTASSTGSNTVNISIRAPGLPRVVHPSEASLSSKLAGDAAIAVMVTSVAAPFLTIVDKALVQRAAGSHTLLSSAHQSVYGILSNPGAYFRSPTFLLMWATYAATYTAANSLKTITEHQEYTAAKKQRPISPGQTTTTLFVGTTLVNSSASLVKDQAYAKLFGTATASSVPALSYGLWIARDFTVIGSSFVLPEYVARGLQEGCDMKESDAKNVAQVATPLAAQLVAGPLHFLGIDIYNRKLDGLSLGSKIVNRGRFLSNAFVEVVLARMARILPGYSIAGVGNAHMRGQWRDYLIQQHVDSMVAAGSKKTATPPALPSPDRKEVSDLVSLIRAKRV